MKNKELENKEMKNPIPVELGNEELENVSGGLKIVVVKSPQLPEEEIKDETMLIIPIV